MLQVIPPPSMRVKPIDIPDSYKLLNCISQDVSKLSKNANICYLHYDNKKTETMTLKDYRNLATVQKYPDNLSYNEIEDLFWKNLKVLASPHTQTKSVPIYAVDNEKSRFPENWPWWNLNELTVRESIILGPMMPGVNTPYLYFAMPFAAFGLHHEDSNLASLNIHHEGAPRRWYSVPSSNATKLEELVQTNVPKSIYCDRFIKHKSTLVPPEILRSNGIDYGTVRQL